MATHLARRTQTHAPTLAELLRSIYVAAALTAAGLWALLTWMPDLGTMLSSVIVGYFALDLLASTLLRGGNGFARSKLLDALDGRTGSARPKGYAYLLHLATILTSVVVLPPVTAALLAWASAEVGAGVARAGLAILLAAAVGYSTHVRYFKRP